MKIRDLIVGVTAVAAMVLLAGCTATVQTLAYDNPIPEQQAATLIIPDGYTVTGFNGRPVKWECTISAINKVAAIKVPSGDNTIVYQYYWYTPPRTEQYYQGQALMQRTTPGRTVSFDGNLAINMEPGRRYIFKGNSISADTEADDRYDKLP